MRASAMIGLWTPCLTGAWLFMILSFTNALPSRLDSSFRATWKDIMADVIALTPQSSTNTCCPSKQNSWVHTFLGDSSTPGGKGIQDISDWRLKKGDGDRSSYVTNRRTIKPSRRMHDIPYFLKLKEIVNRISILSLKKQIDQLLTHLPPDSSQVFQDSYLLNETRVIPSSLRSPPLHKRSRGKSYTFVHGKDDRTRIVPFLLRRFPYSNFVRLSTGCTGTLVTPIHILTAAHCVHDGLVFRNKLEMLKVMIPDTIGVRVYYIEKIGISEKWLNSRGRMDRQAFYDVAVVRLSSGVHGRSRFFPLGVPSQQVLDQRLQFFGFPLDNLGLWRSVCSNKYNKALMDGNLILTRCDSAIGNSGAAVLAADTRTKHKIIGVLSSTMPVGRMPHYTRYNIITALTWYKLHFICGEIGRIGVDYGVCPSSEKIPQNRSYQKYSRVIPFFG